MGYWCVNFKSHRLFCVILLQYFGLPAIAESFLGFRRRLLETVVSRVGPLYFRVLCLYYVIYI